MLFRYAAFQDLQVKKGKLRPLGEGVLILDEVKVIGKVMWNSRNGRMVGLAMDPCISPSLSDLDPDNIEKEQRAAEYFLQFLWRDVSSSFDIIGPHYSTVRSMDAHFTYACLMDCIDAFQAFKFKVFYILTNVCIS